MIILNTQLKQQKNLVVRKTKTTKYAFLKLELLLFGQAHILDCIPVKGNFKFGFSSFK